MNMIEDLYYGKISPINTYTEGDSRCAEFLNIIAKNEEKLMAFLKCIPNTQEQQHLLTQFSNVQCELTSFNELEKFIEGFQLGAKLMLDTFILPQQSVMKRDID